VPAAAVIPAPAVYTNIAAVKTLVVDCRVVGVDQPWWPASYQLVRFIYGWLYRLCLSLASSTVSLLA
jgi:hypothetical protein